MGRSSKQESAAAKKRKPQPTPVRRRPAVSRSASKFARVAAASGRQAARASKASPAGPAAASSSSRATSSVQAAGAKRKRSSSGGKGRKKASARKSSAASGSAPKTPQKKASHQAGAAASSVAKPKRQRSKVAKQEAAKAESCRKKPPRAAGATTAASSLSSRTEKSWQFSVPGEPSYDSEEDSYSSDMDLFGGASESATNSNLPASLQMEEGQQQRMLASMLFRGGPGGGEEGGSRGPDLPGGALGSFLLKRSMGGEDGANMSRFSSMFRDLKSNDGSRQIVALTELSEYLSFSSEEALITFPMETFIPLLISLLEDPGHSDELAAQAMLLCCRCLFNVVDVLPPTSRIITACGGLPVLCANLLNVAYIDVAELAVAIIERISEDQPLQVLKAGGLQAITTFLDFFQIAVQRQAISAAALMLVPQPPADVFEQHVRPVLPTLSQLLQHSDPQVLLSVCDCWRRMLDNVILAHGMKAPAAPTSDDSASPSAGSRNLAKGRWRQVSGGGDGRKGDAAGADSSAVSAGVANMSLEVESVSTVLEEMCPSGALSNLLMLIASGTTAPSPHSAAITGEAMYILSILINYSNVFAKEVLQQDICALLRQTMLSMENLSVRSSMQGGPQSQSSFALLRVLSLVGSLLPALHLSDSGCECDAARLALFTEEPSYLETLGEAFLPVLVDAYEGSMEPALQSLCVTLLLAFFLACRDRPEAIKRSVEPTRLACLLAHLLLVGTSNLGVMLSCLLIVQELLERSPVPYSLLFVRHGVVRAIHQLVTKGSSRSGKAVSPSQVGAAAEACGSRSPSKSQKRKLVDEAAHRVLSSYFASSSHTGESAILRSLGKIATQLRSSPTATIAAHREALSKLRDLIMAEDGITEFEFTCSGTASALNAFLYPIAETTGEESPATVSDMYGDRLRLFLECMGATSSPQPSGGAFPRLVRLCVASVRRSERQPLALFLTNATMNGTLPLHLRARLPPPSTAASLQQRGLPLGLAVEMSPPGLGGLRRGGGHDAGANNGNAAALAVLRLLAKPVRVRMQPLGGGRPQALATPSTGITSPNSHESGSSASNNLRAFLMPFGSGSKGNDSAGTAAAAAAASAAPAQGPPTASASSSQGSPGKAVGAQASGDGAPQVAASPATRLRNYLASKVTRKRSSGTAGVAGMTPGSVGSSSPAATPATPEKRGAMASLLLATTMSAKGRGAAAAAAAATGLANATGGGGSSSSTAAAGEARSSKATRSSGAGGDAGAGRDEGEGRMQSGGSNDEDRELMGPPGVGHRRSGGGRGAPGDNRLDDFGLLPASEFATLLVEPLATVNALEEYIWEKHRHRHLQQKQRSLSNSGSGGGAAGQGEARSGQARATAKPKPPPLTAMSNDRSTGDQQAPSPPRTPLAIVEPGTPSTTLEDAANRSGDANMSGITSGSGGAGGGDSDGASDGEAMVKSVEAGSLGTRQVSGQQSASSSPPRKRVRISIGGRSLPSKASVVQALVADTIHKTGSGGVDQDISSLQQLGGGGRMQRSLRNNRFLVTTEDEESAEEADVTDKGGAVSSTSSAGGIGSGSGLCSRNFCGAIWGRVHCMSYEILDETQAAGSSSSSSSSAAKAVCGDAASGSCGGHPRNSIVDSDFDCLVQRHARLTGLISVLGSKLAEQRSPFLAPWPSIGSPRGEGAPDAKKTTVAAEVAEEGEAGGEDELITMLKLVTSFHNMCEYMRAPKNFGVVQTEGLPQEEDFQCHSLTSKLLRQLSDPLAICTGSIPAWCARLPSACRFLFPYSARRVLHQSCGLGLSRALHHVQQRVLAQSSHGQDAQRRLEGEVAVANIPRQKVRISRQRILDSALKVMNNYATGNSILEVEYVGEVGTGSGPTLEFYAQVADILKTSEQPRLFRKGAQGGLLFPEPMVQLVQKTSGGGDGEASSSSQVLERFRLLGQLVAKCIMDNRLVDLQLHPLFWRIVLDAGPISLGSLRDIDAELFASLNEMRNMSEDDLENLCIDFTLPGHPDIELQSGGASVAVNKSNVKDYIRRVAEVALVESVSAQATAFRKAFCELLPLDTCKIWSERELSSIIVGSSVLDSTAWTMEHLTTHIKAQHGYNADSRCFRELLEAMASFSTEERRSFLAFATGAPALPVGGFAGLKPPLTVVKKEAPPAPLTPDQFMPSVMTCASYLKLPEYSSADILRQKLDLAMSEGQSAFLLS
eukprot:TRINITY_DN24397_c0_g1_i1.p1 TRINITY_DN24397_c0_g1~~TRINITY_DN24397_c0_g1_i1.p1  ORF type:complete len:2192 (+),score=550.41 TRINITY_DN24397_c0_g1_i1:129-6704(+)